MTNTLFAAFTTKRLRFLSLLLMGLGINLSNAQEVIFYTPRTVHIVKAKGDQPKQSSLVVTAHPEKGTGRPTKKERRDLDEFLGDDNFGLPDFLFFDDEEGDEVE